MSETLNKLTRLQHLVDLGTRTKSELNALDAKIQEIVNTGGQPNVIEEIWLNGVKQTVEEGKAVKLTVEQYDDTAIAGRISAIEGDYLKEADKYDDTALVGRVKTIEDDYLKGADKTELQDGIDTNAQAIAAVKGDVDAFFKDADLTESAKDTLKEIQDYINSDASAASEMTASIQQNAQAITAVEGRVGTAEGKITTLEGKAHEHANKDVIDGITAEKVAAWNAAEGNAKTYADGLNTAMDARVQVVEGKAHEHSNKDVLDGITSAKISAWDAAEGNAKAYAKEYADGLAVNYDNKGAAAGALSDAKTYADGLNAAMNARVVAIETDYLSSANIASNAEVTAALDGVFGA